MSIELHICRWLGAISRALRAKERVRNGRGYFHPSPEELEQRMTPDAATYTWTGNGIGDGALWSVLSNWQVNNQQPTRLPGGKDTVQFTQGNATCVVDGSFQVWALDIQNAYTGTIDVDNSLVATNINQNGGTIAGVSYLTTLEDAWTAGTVQSNLVIPAFACAVIAQNVTLTGTLTNNGVVVLSTDNDLGPATITDNGSIFNGSDAVFRAQGDDISTISGQGTFTTNGTLDVESQLNLEVESTMSGTMTVNAFLNFSANTYFMPDTTVAGDGNVNFVDNNVVIMGNLTFSEGSVGLNSSAAGLSVLGALAFNNTGIFAFTSEVTVATNGSVYVGVNALAWQGADLDVTSVGSISNGGAWTDGVGGAGDINLGSDTSFLNTSGLVLSANMSITGPGSLKNQGEVTVLATATLSAPFSNTGSLSVEFGGAVVIPGDWTNYGTLAFYTPLALGVGGTFEVDGTFTNNGFIQVDTPTTIYANLVANNGTISFQQWPAGSNGVTLVITALPGQVLGGNFTQTAIGAVDMSITNIVTCGGLGGADLLAVNGVATLDGTWNVSVTPGLDLASDQTWMLISAGTVAQQFATVNLPVDFSTQYYAASVWLTYSAV